MPIGPLQRKSPPYPSTSSSSSSSSPISRGAPSSHTSIMAVTPVRSVMGRSIGIFLSSPTPFLTLSLLLFSFRSLLHLSTLSLLSSLDSSTNHSLPISTTSTPRPPPHPRNPHSHHHLDQAEDRDHDQQRPQLFNASFLLPHHQQPLTLIKIQFWREPNSPLVFYQQPSSDSPQRPRLSMDLPRLLRLAALFLALHVYAISGFVLFYSIALGVAFYAVACALMGVRLGSFQCLYMGSRLGLRRLPVFVFLFWAIRDASAQLLSVVVLSDVRGGAAVLRLFLKVKVLPFAKTAIPPSVRLASGLAGATEFLVLWSIVDTAITVVFMVVFCVAMMRRNSVRRSGAVFREACSMVVTMTGQAVFINCLEVLVCKDGGRRALMAVGGPWVAEAVQSIGEMYFMVVWLVFYFVAKSRVGETPGRRFRWREVLNGNNLWR